jgi:tetratricopeptide (TPR) repeat protein
MGDATAAASLRREALVDAVHRSGLPLGRVVSDLSERLDVDTFVKAWDEVAPEITDPVEQARLRNIQAQFLIAKKQLERALPYVDAGVKLNDPKLIEHTDAIVMRAQVLDQLGRTDEAVKAYEAIIAHAPDEVAALNNLAYLLATKANQPKAALQYSQRAINIVDNNPPLALLDTHAWILYLNQLYEESEGRLREALSIDPDYLPALEHLALLLEKTDRKIEAKRFFENLRSSAERAKDQEVVKKADEGLQRLK